MTREQLQDRQQPDSSDNPQKSRHGIARWLEEAPPTASWEEIADAQDTYSSPSDAWSDAQDGEFA